MADEDLTLLDVTPQQAAWDATVNTNFSRLRAFLREGPLPAFTNDTGATLTAGTLVFVSGVDGTTLLPTVTKAKADAIGTLALHVVQFDVLNTEDGTLAPFAYVEDVDTSGQVAGDPVYLSASASGGFTFTKPVEPNIVQRVGTVLKVDASTGIILFHVFQPDRLDKLALSAGAEAADVIQVTIQVQDADGANISRRATLTVWLAASDFGAPAAPDTSMNLVDGTELKEDTADALFRVVTDATGKATFDITEMTVVTHVLHAQLADRVVKLNVVFA